MQHRFSDWLALHRRLGELGVGPLPSAPARLPFRGYAVTRHREYALNRYLQAALPAAEPSPRGRALLLRFLCRSHMHWLYEPDARAAPLPRVRDVSTGADAALQRARRRRGRPRRQPAAARRRGRRAAVAVAA